MTRAEVLDRAPAAGYNEGMSKLNQDGNLLGRLGAIAVLAAAGFGLHRLNCGAGEMCPLMKTDSCCAGAEGRAEAEAPKTAPAVSAAAVK